MTPFTRDECRKCAIGKCPIEARTAKDITRLHFTDKDRVGNYETDEKYCLWLAFCMLTDLEYGKHEFDKMDIIYYPDLKYYNVNNERHRLCIANKLFEMGLEPVLYTRIEEGGQNLRYEHLKNEIEFFSHRSFKNAIVISIVSKIPEEGCVSQLMCKISSRYRNYQNLKAKEKEIGELIKPTIVI